MSFQKPQVLHALTLIKEELLSQNSDAVTTHAEPEPKRTNDRVTSCRPRDGRKSHVIRGARQKHWHFNRFCQRGGRW